MISHFFIDRPIFAAVLSILVTLAGAVALTALPVAQYPEVAPPTVVVTAAYPGANAKTVRDTVAAPIEQQVSGVENMLYMSSQCTNDGSYTLTVTFKLGMDSDMAQVLVQNRVALAQPVIPQPRAAAGHQRQEDVAQHDDDRQPDLQPTGATTTSSSATISPFKSRTNWAAWRAWPTSPTSASATIACAPGSTRRNWPPWA